MRSHIPLFLRQLEDQNRAPATIDRYGRLLERFADFGERELREAPLLLASVDKALIAAFVRESSAEGSALAPATRNARLAALRSFFEFLVAEDCVGRDPSVGVAYARLPVRNPTFLTAEEFCRLCQTVERNATERYLRRDLAILVTFWHTGLRLSELLSIDVEQIDIPDERFRLVKRKGGDVVDVHFNVEVTIVLRRWLWERRRYTGADEASALFLSDRGNRLSARAVEDLVKKYVSLARLGKLVTPHTLRHSCATALVRRGNGIEVVAEVLHHRQLSTTRKYVHLVGEQVHAAVASLAEPAEKRPTA